MKTRKKTKVWSLVLMMLIIISSYLGNMSVAFAAADDVVTNKNLIYINTSSPQRLLAFEFNSDLTINPTPVVNVIPKDAGTPLDDMGDIAIDNKGRLWGVSFGAPYKVYRLHPLTGEVIQTINMPFQDYINSFSGFGDKIIAGSVNAGFKNYLFDPDTNTWTPIPASIEQNAGDFLNLDNKSVLSMQVGRQSLVGKINIETNTSEAFKGITSPDNAQNKIPFWGTGNIGDHLILGGWQGTLYISDLTIDDITRQTEPNISIKPMGFDIKTVVPVLYLFGMATLKESMPSIAMLETTKTVDQSEVGYGDVVTFSINATNSVVNTTLVGVQVEDVLPAGLELVADTLKVDGVSVTNEATGNAIKTTLSNIKGVNTVKVTFQAKITKKIAGKIENIATVTDLANPTTPQKPSADVDVKPYIIHYDSNTTAATTKVPADSQHIAGLDVTVERSIKSDDKTFIGWNTQPDGKGVMYDPKDVFNMPKGDVTLYAIWIDDQPTIHYDPNTKSPTSPLPPDISFPAGSTVIIQPGITTDGKTFIGWNTEPDGSGKMYDLGDPFDMPKDDVTLYAIWSDNLTTNNPEVFIIPSSIMGFEPMPTQKMQTHDVTEHTIDKDLEPNDTPEKTPSNYQTEDISGDDEEYDSVPETIPNIPQTGDNSGGKVAIVIYSIMSAVALVFVRRKHHKQ